MVALMPMQAQAQVAELVFNDGSMIGPQGVVLENGNCFDSTNQIFVKLDPVPTRAPTVHVFAITRGGPDKFRRVPDAQLDNAGDNRTSNDNIRSSTSVTIAANDADRHTANLCWRNNIIDSGASEVDIMIANGAGYTVHPTKGKHRFTIPEEDVCDQPAMTPGGVVWKESGCRCAMHSTNAEVRRLTSPEPRVHTRLRACADGETLGDPPVCSTDPGVPATTRTDTQAEEGWRQNLRSVAAQFSDPFYLYCPSSPWKGLP